MGAGQSTTTSSVGTSATSAASSIYSQYNLPEFRPENLGSLDTNKKREVIAAGAKFFELPPNFDENDLRKAYHRASLRWHPDKPTGDATIFQIVQKLLVILQDDIDRRKYEADHISLRSQYHKFVESQRGSIQPTQNVVTPTTTIHEREHDIYRHAPTINTRRNLDDVPPPRSNTSCGYRTGTTSASVCDVNKHRRNVVRGNTTNPINSTYDSSRFNRSTDTITTGYDSHTQTIHEAERAGYNIQAAPLGHGKGFNRDKFNKVFDENRIPDAVRDHGYGDWLRSGEDMIPESETRGVSAKNMATKIAEIKRRRPQTDIIEYHEPREIYAATGALAVTTIDGGDAPETYTSDFSLTGRRGAGDVQFVDVKEAFTNTLLIDADDPRHMAARGGEFSSVEQYMNARNSRMDQLFSAEELERQRAAEDARKRAEEQRRDAVRRRDAQIAEHYNRMSTLLLKR